MVNETVEKVPLETLAKEIAQHATQGDRQTIEAAMLMRAARSRIENGELGETTWYEWARKNIKLSETRLRELQRIAKAEDPQKELERLRGHFETLNRWFQAQIWPLFSGILYSLFTALVATDNREKLTLPGFETDSQRKCQSACRASPGEEEVGAVT